MNGTLTAFGERQMYLRGREMRKRYITTNGFLSSSFNPAEVQAFSIYDRASIASAEAYFSGFYPSDPALSITDPVQQSKAVPPFNMDQTLLTNW